MKPTGFFSALAGKFIPKPLFLLPLLALLCVLVTGCPHNEYTVELKPQGDSLERTLTFYRADGTDSNGAPKYLEFPTNELAAITRVYPAGAVRRQGQEYQASGTFSRAMPGDVGGSGSFTRLKTPLGEMCFYLERFRGNDDLAAQNAKQFAAADQITDLVTGWAKGEFGREPGWKNLNQFLEKDFRHDLKNAGLYAWTQKVGALTGTNAPGAFSVRFAQYLLERGYFEPSDLPTVIVAIHGDGDTVWFRLMQRLALKKLELTAAALSEKKLAVLADPAAFEQSWAKYLAGTTLYRAQLKEWETRRKLDPKLERPAPEDAMDGLFAELTGDSWGNGETDELTVRLALGRAPTDTNGRWEDGQVIWKIKLDPDRTLPALCHAAWSQADAAFQQARFGRVLLDGDELVQYCFWQTALGEAEAAEWNQFLATLQPGADLAEKISSFHFSTEPAAGSVEEEPDSLRAGVKFLADALEAEPEPAKDSK